MTESNRPYVIHTVHDLYSAGCTTLSESGQQRATVAVPYPATLKERVVAAWWVITGRAHALRWPEPGEIEAALDIPDRKQGGDDD